MAKSRGEVGRASCVVHRGSWVVGCELRANNESKRSSRHAIIEQELSFLTYDLKCFVLYEARNTGHMELFRTNWGYENGTNDTRIL